jgi:hypothetical protein
MSMTAITSKGQDHRPRKKSAMITQGLVVGTTVCGMLLALALALRYGTAGHSAPSGHTCDSTGAAQPSEREASVEPTPSAETTLLPS